MPAHMGLVDLDAEARAGRQRDPAAAAPDPLAQEVGLDVLRAVQLQRVDVERGRELEGVYVPLANTEGGLSISLYRGARAVGESGGFRTYVLGDRITRASAFLFDSTAQAVAFAAWIETQLEDMRAWLESEPIPNLSRHAKLRKLETHVVGPMCHVMYAFTTGDACGMNMITRNSFALNQGFVVERASVRPRRAMLEGNMGGDKKPSARYFERGGHGKTVIAEATLTDEAVRRVLKTTIDDLVELAFVGTHGAVASGMQSVAFTPATAIAAIFLAMYTRSISPASHGSFYELYAIAAAVLGGFSLRGGEGSMIGVVLGAVLLQVLQNLVNLLGIPSSLNFAVMGSVILFGVIADQQFANYRERRALRAQHEEVRTAAGPEKVRQ